MSDLQKIFEVRVELEAYAARLAAERASPQELAAMEALLADSEATIRVGDHRQLIKLDHQAHRLLAQAAHNEFLEDTLERHYNHVLRLWNVSLHKVSRLREAIEEHREIIAALRARDAKRASEIMRSHVSRFQSEFTAAL